MVIDIKIDDKDVTNLLKTLQSRVQHMQPIMRQVAEIMRDAVEENFEKEGRPEKWKHLSPSTVVQREKKGHWPGKILQVEGQLASSISAKATNTEAIVGTKKKYAAIHQFGGQAGRKHAVEIPARPFLKCISQDFL